MEKVKKTRNRVKYKTEHIKLLITPEHKDRLRAYCKKHNMTMTKVITDCILEKI